MKKILGLVILVFGLVTLVACGSSQEKATDGTWYKFYQHEGYDMQISKLYPMTIVGDELVYRDKVYNIDYKEGVARVKANEGETAEFSYKDGVVMFLDKSIRDTEETFVLDGSKEYKKLVEDGAKINE